MRDIGIISGSITSASFAFLLPLPANRPSISNPKNIDRSIMNSCVKTADSTVKNTTKESRIACLCQYNGAGFSGWERKPATRTVQGTIEKAILDVSGKSLLTAGASKTDASTHAVGQVFHFDVPFIFHDSRAWTKALNNRLPNDILILAAEGVPTSFHARKSAMLRRYRYTILSNTRNSVFISPFVWHLYQKPLNVIRMNAAAQTLKSQDPEDFSAFRKSRSAAGHTNIVLHDISVRYGAGDPNLVEIEVCASWFVYGMMRLLTAALVEVGRGNIGVEEFYNIFRLRQRHRIKHSAPASGLCLLEVVYPSELNPFANVDCLTGNSHLTLGLSPFPLTRS